MTKMDSPAITNMDLNEKHCEEVLKNVLNPIEPFVMKVQSLLVWESPVRSAILFIFIHFIFWYFAISGCQIYFMISVSLICTYFIRTWKRKIWPEIRVPPKEPEDPDSWTPVHPRLLSVPEICKYLAQIWCSMSRFIHNCLVFRSNHRFLFCVVTSSVFISLALFGQYVPGVMLSYITVISLMLWPSVLYHNLLQKVYLKFEPVFMKLDYTMKLKSKWSFKTKKSKSHSKDGSGLDDNAHTDTDSEDFSPSLDPAATAVLARVITDSEDESNGTPSIYTPMLSKEPSFSDDHDEDFTPDLENLPSIGHLDDTDDEILMPSLPSLPSSGRNSHERDSIQFHPSHFGDTTDEEDETYTQDLNFPDINDINSPPPPSQKERENERKKKELKKQEEKLQQEAGMALLASSMITQTFTSMMQSAMSGLNRMATSTTSGSKSKQVSYVKDNPEVDIQSESRTQTEKAKLPRQQASDSDVDFVDEFEFLDQYDVDDDDGDGDEK